MNSDPRNEIILGKEKTNVIQINFRKSHEAELQAQFKPNNIPTVNCVNQSEGRMSWLTVEPITWKNQ